MTYAGIDPGLSGAVALIRDDGSVTVSDAPTEWTMRNKKKKREYVIADMVKLLRDQNIDLAILEKVGAMPGQGVTSMFAFGRGLGLWEGILAALQIPYQMVAPQTWKKQMLGSGDNSVKATSIMRALELFPNQLRDQINLAKHDGRAEAVLMAAYGKAVLEKWLK